MPLIKMKGQRRQHQPGDIFMLRPEGHGFRFGRIVKTGQSGSKGRFPGGILAYVYDVPAETETEAEKPDLPALTPDRLLLPPFFTALALDQGLLQDCRARSAQVDRPAGSALLLRPRAQWLRR
ncbi:Imm26 family immunity protein [Streptomyces swartbergensis]|uniref:Imm26 family immunity protein n=1 Tax=Streptomyces swartbergensis TaxID=487165 RepID=UPI00117CB515|nr:Imm26 family immunity protein [Streptomyces swartbergensis]